MPDQAKRKRPAVNAATVAAIAPSILRVRARTNSRMLSARREDAMPGRRSKTTDQLNGDDERGNEIAERARADHEQAGKLLIVEVHPAMAGLVEQPRRE